MQIIKAVFFEPVGCLADFPAKAFDDIVARVFKFEGGAARSRSEAYWRLLDLMQRSGTVLTSAQTKTVEELELQAVEAVELYEDVVPALSALNTMSISLVVTSSLSAVAVSRFLDKFLLAHFFSAVWTRDSAGGVKTAPLARALQSASFQPEHVMSLFDTSDGLKVAKEVGVNSILMIDDPDEARRMALEAPTGGIVSLHELPDAIRLVAENAKTPTPDRA
jgi:beta-phosphoglucomutase-like phosphatase (HAD superfamily)